MALSQEMIREIAEKTVGQSKNPLWHPYRKGRITASHFGEIIKAFDKYHNYKTRYDSGFLTIKYKLLRNEKPPNVPAIEWGISHEADGKQHMKQAQGK